MDFLKLNMGGFLYAEATLDIDSCLDYIMSYSLPRPNTVELKRHLAECVTVHVILAN